MRYGNKRCNKRWDTFHWVWLNVLPKLIVKPFNISLNESYYSPTSIIYGVQNDDD